MTHELLEWKGEKWWLSSERCLFWESERLLVLSDFHVGKAAHFRKSGLAIPQQIFQDDLMRFFQQVQYFNPDSILITGDLFHSAANKEHEWFGKWREQLGNRNVLLVKGNHEILSQQEYESLGIQCVGNILRIRDFMFMHDLPKQWDEKLFYITGHQHPGIRIAGKGKQSMTLPCFFFSSKYAVLPAFSKFSGKHILELKKNEFAYAIVENKLESHLMRIPSN